MASSSRISTEAIASLTGLKYSPPRSQVIFRICAQVAIEVTMVIAILVVTITSSGAIIAGTYLGMNLVFQILLILSVIVFGFLIAIVALLWRSRIVGNGIISLEFPIRRISGGLNRVIGFRDVIDVGSDIGNGDSFGLGLALSDGTKVFLDQDGFGIDGFRILDAICKAFGKSYENQVKKLLLPGIRYRFDVARIRRVEDDTILLVAAIWTFSRREIKKIPLDKIRKTEQVGTHYSGDGYLVWLNDGTAFILREDEVEAAGLPAMPSWSGKLATSNVGVGPQRSNESAD